MERIRGRHLIILLALAFLTACMPKIQNEDPVASPELLSHEILRYSGTLAKVLLHGTCPITTKEFRISAEDISHTVASTSASLLDSSGVPVAKCTNGVLLIEYPVPNPTAARVIPFKVKVKTNDGRLSMYWSKLNVNYAMPLPNISGFAVTSGGADVTGGTKRVLGSAGEPAGVPLEINGGAIKLRSGLHGVLFDEGI